MSKLTIDCVHHLLTPLDLDTLAHQILYRSLTWYLGYVREQCDGVDTIEAGRFGLYRAIDEEHLYEQVLLDNNKLPKRAMRLCKSATI